MSLNDNAEDSITDFYENDNKNSVVEEQAVSSLTLDDIMNLKKSNYDGWNKNFYELKKTAKEWKMRWFHSLKPGDSLIEIGCGRGFNLLMTAEILKEEYNIDNIYIYGVEYVKSSVEIANKVLEQALPLLGFKLGSDICIGDASNLFYIEDESFDFVYTGHIEAIDDPLNFEEELERQFEPSDICNNSSWSKKKLLYQKAQEDWFAAWAGEMIRIAKKGKPVIFEEISPSICEAPDDWGGVSRDWWSKAILTYGWDVEVDSIIIENYDEASGNASRYRVFMKKKVRSVS